MFIDLVPRIIEVFSELSFPIIMQLSFIRHLYYFKRKGFDILVHISQTDCYKEYE